LPQGILIDIKNTLYNSVRSLDESGRISWATHIKHQYCSSSVFGYAWLVNEVGDTIDTFTKMFKMHVVDCTIQKPN